MLLNSLYFMVLKITTMSLLYAQVLLKEILNILTLDIPMMLFIY